MTLPGDAASEICTKRDCATSAPTRETWEMSRCVAARCHSFQELICTGAFEQWNIHHTQSKCCPRVPLQIDDRTDLFITSILRTPTDFFPGSASHLRFGVVEPSSCMEWVCDHVTLKHVDGNKTWLMMHMSTKYQHRMTRTSSLRIWSNRLQNQVWAINLTGFVFSWCTMMAAQNEL